jgi:flagellar biosynthesis protein FlhF
MRIKRYEAEERELPRVIRQIKRDLGDNAVMKTRRYKKGGLLGLGGKPMVEVYAGVDRDLGSGPDRKNSSDRPSSGSALLEQLLQNSANHNGGATSTQPDTNRSAQAPVIYLPPSGTSPASAPSQTAVATPSTGRLEVEVQRLAREISEIRRALEEGLAGRKPEPQVQTPGLPRWLGHIREKLVGNEVDPETADAMIQETLQAAGVESLSDFELTLTTFQRTVTSSIEARGCLVGTQNPRIIALAGPTGVGKTTTLAKLAATANLLDKQRVGLISADTYRIAAIDQLKTFAGILDIPVKIVFSPAEMREALNDYSGMDRIFIDTAGRSPNNDERLEELRELMEAHEDVACHLVISATTRPKDMHMICERFRPSKFSRFIFTKIDETDCIGPLLALMYAEGLPASYLTNGQSVPDDIVLGEESDLISLIVRRSLA